MESNYSVSESVVALLGSVEEVSGNGAEVSGHSVVAWLGSGRVGTLVIVGWLMNEVWRVGDMSVLEAVRILIVSVTWQYILWNALASGHDMEILNLV